MTPAERNERWARYCEAMAMQAEAMALSFQIGLLALQYDDQIGDRPNAEASARKLTSDYMRIAAEWRQNGVRS